MARKLLVKWLKLDIKAMTRTSVGTFAKEESVLRVTDSESPLGVKIFFGL
jgi:hypothetical protein